jgi:uncharacterized protein YggE
MKSNELLYALIGIVLVIVVVELALILQFSNNIAYIKGVIGSGGGHISNTSYNPNLSFLTVSATGSATGVPSKAEISLDLQGKGLTASAATYNLSKELSQANATLMKYVEGNRSNIQTTYYNLYNQTSYYYSTYNGYIAQEELSVTIPSIKNVSPALGALANISGVSIYGSSGILSDSQLSQLRTTALAQAMSNATAQAKALLPGKNLSVSNITIGYYPRIYPLPYALGGTAAEAISNSSVTTSPEYFNGTETVTESITVVFAYNK